MNFHCRKFDNRAAAGGPCSDPVLGFDVATLASQLARGSFPSGSLSIVQGLYAGQTPELQTTASAMFQNGSVVSGVVSLGSCAVTSVLGGPNTPGVPPGYALDAGSLSIQGPAGTLHFPPAGSSGMYSLQASNSFFPPSGGSFQFTGTGGQDVGKFTASISYANPLNWTNMSAVSTVVRANGQTVTWTGGANDSYVSISGTSSSDTVSASFTCNAPAAAGQFTIPAYVLETLPPGSVSLLLVPASLQVANLTTPRTFSATGIFAGSVTAGVVFVVDVLYQ